MCRLANCPAQSRIVPLQEFRFVESTSMAKFDDSLRGYGFPIHLRDGFCCQYCGLDGSTWPNWLTLSVDHLLPKDHPLRENEDFVVTACNFCNTADNQFFRHAIRRGLRFDGMSPAQLVEQRKPYVEQVRRAYKEFWESKVSAR